jgi:hypothetical protein
MNPKYLGKTGIILRILIKDPAFRKEDLQDLDIIGSKGIPPQIQNLKIFKHTYGIMKGA